MDLITTDSSGTSWAWEFLHSIAKNQCFLDLTDPGIDRLAENARIRRVPSLQSTAQAAYGSTGAMEHGRSRQMSMERVSPTTQTSVRPDMMN
jgi:hypothetical protein